MICAGVGKVVLFVWLISEVYVEAFRCNNRKLIEDEKFCDRIDDCGDLSDETIGCDSSDGPRRGTFRCEEYRYLDIRQRCDMKADCRDGSDERNCGDQITIENCTMHNGKYLCKDRSRCIDFQYTCDFRNDCDDGSDENQYNCAKYGYELSFNSCASCPHFCVPTPNGPECACNSSTYESSELCKQIKDCTGSGTTCDQYCSEYRSRSMCSCHEDYHLDGDKCRTNVSYGNTLVYSTATKIKVLNRTSAQLQVLQNGVNCTALTAANDFVYFATFDSKNRKGHIVKSSIHRSPKSDVILESGSYVTSIAVDWITNNIYFTTNESLSLCSNNGRICAEINVCKVDYVALAPQFGWMYFSQQTDYVDERLIIRSNMDGSDRRILTDGSYQFPVLLAVDEIIETVYWFETRRMQLHSISFHGTRKQEFSTGWPPYVTFNAFEGYLFASRGNNEIYKFKWDGRDDQKY